MHDHKIRLAVWLMSWLLGAVAADSGWAQSTEAKSATAEPLNVLFIMADDFRPELGCYGSPALTPQLDLLAQRSLLFQRAYCQQAVCNPSRSSLLCGLRPDTLQVWNNSTHFRQKNPSVVTLPEWFRRNGYTTRCVGKIFHNWHTTIQGDRQSWSAPEFLHYANHGDDLPQVAGELPTNLAQTTSGFGYAKSGICECRDVPDEAYYDGRVANEAVRVLQELKAQPFFLAVGFWKPHAQFNAPKRYWDMYQRDRLPTLNAVRPEAVPALALHESTEVLGPLATQRVPTAEQAAEMRHGYFANISYLDAQVGKVLSALKESGVAERTIVVFLSDHGYHIGEHTLWGKTSNFEYDAQVPLLVHVPRLVTTAQRTTALTELIDLFPTLAELCDLPTPLGLDGTSFVPVLKAPDVHVKNAAYTQHPRPAYYDRTPSGTPVAMGVSVRTADCRYTEWRDWKSGVAIAQELYLQADQPQETKNRAGKSDVAQLQSAAAQLLRIQFPQQPH